MEQWEPHTVTTLEELQPGPVAALAGIFDNGLPAPGPGDCLPPLWHWIALARWPVSSELGSDGHPARGQFLPPIELPRRMFAGGEVRFHTDLQVGDDVRRESTVQSVTEKVGRSGRLVVVVVMTRLYRLDGRLAIEERQDLIYREAAAPSDTAAAPVDAATLEPVGSPFRRADMWNWDFATDPTLLMRFSAASANAHRIHYDWPYTTRVEGYPGLVVHGPLITLALAEVLRLHHDPRRVSRLRHRNLAPLFCGQSARLCGRSDPDGFALDLIGPGGDTAGAHTTLTLEFQKGTSDA
ncbi:FAS1-like dehydratase domain-containing protein [Nocardia sp. NPDC004123]